MSQPSAYSRTLTWVEDRLQECREEVERSGVPMAAERLCARAKNDEHSPDELHPYDMQVALRDALDPDGSAGFW